MALTLKPRLKFKEEIKGFTKECGKRFWDYDGRNIRFDWCAIFVSYAMRELAGITDFPKTASCGTIASWGRTRMNHSYGTAEIGDIILFELNKNRADGPEHVGIVIDCDDNGTITTIEGNTGSEYYDNSSVNIFKYSDYSCFSSIIDMSDFFCNDEVYNELNKNYEKFFEDVVDLVQKYKLKI